MDNTINSEFEQQLGQLGKILAGKNHLLIIIHDYPDPDAIMSAAALRYLVKNKYNLDSSIAYGGDIGRAENRALVRILKINMKQINRIKPDKYDIVAMVDTQPGVGNHSMPSNMRCNIVIDHHPLKKAYAADLLLVKPGLGGTATILVEWLRASNLPIQTDLAAGLAYAISSETQYMGRDATTPDIDAYLYVYSKANLKILSQVMFPKLSRSHFLMLRSTLNNAVRYCNLICSHLGDVPFPEIVAEMADFLVRHERISWSLCTGRFKDKLILSLRTSNRNAKAYKLIRKLVVDDRTAGGHEMTAGGYILLQGKKADLIEKEITQKFAKILKHKDAEWKNLYEADIPFE
ncbi:MAG: DHH family phosphoesterase [Candidatus Latescibacterota bacterium]